MEKTDVLIVGAGLLGTFCALNLRRYDLNVCVLEKNGDVSTGISKANTGIVYTGYDAKPGTLKSRLCVNANAGFSELCRRLDVPFSRCGSLLLSFGDRGDSVIAQKAEYGRANDVPDLRILSKEEVLAAEPCISEDVRSALYAKNTGTVNPWELCIAAYECAGSNGAAFFFDQEVRSLARSEEGFIVETQDKTWQARAVINCAGLCSDKVRELCEQPKLGLFPSASDYIITDTQTPGTLRHVIFQEPEVKGKGLTLVPTVDGNILIGPTKRHGKIENGFPTDPDGISELIELCRTVVPRLPVEKIIRTFGSARPEPYYVSIEDGERRRGDKDISGFSLLEENGLYSLIGIKTPGMTCAHELGKHVAGKAAAFLAVSENNKDFKLERKGIASPLSMTEEERAAFLSRDPEYGKLFCRCRHISEGEIREAIRRGADTIDGVKRRTGAGMGRCQGAYCMLKIAALIAEERKIPITSVTKSGPGTELFSAEKNEADRGLLFSNNGGSAAGIKKDGGIC